jgi:ABC-type multidrug transport system ATPase subunit
MDLYRNSECGFWINTGICMNNLHVDSVIKTFGINQVLTDIFLACNQGEIIGLLGRNGSGKSTLLKIIFGSIPADRKFVKVGSRLIMSLFDSRKLIKYLPQDNFLPGHIKIKRIINLFCNRVDAEIVAANPHISPLLGKKANHLSSGEKRLVEIFLIIHSNADFVLIDEPFNGVAPVYKDEIKNLIREQSKAKGFIITDHDYRNILDVATRIILLYDGGTKEITHNEDLKYWGYIPETA